MPLADCRIIALSKVSDPRGNLTFLEGGTDLPFEIARVYYLYDVPAGSERGSHAHKELQQLMIAASGSFDVVLDDGEREQRFRLSRPDQGLLICPFIWRSLENFSSGSLCLVLASAAYDESDYIRDYAEFLEVVTSWKMYLF